LDYVAGNWYSTPFTSRASTSVVVNTVYLIPFIAGKDQTFTQLAANVAVGKADTVITLGVYNSTSTGFPSTRLASGSTTGDATGVRSVTGLSISMTKGQLYWLASVVTNPSGLTGFSMSTASSATNPLISSMAQTSGFIGVGNVNGFGAAGSSLPATWSATTLFATCNLTYIGF